MSCADPLEKRLSVSTCAHGSEPLMSNPMKIVSAREFVLPVGSLVSGLRYAESGRQVLVCLPLIGKKVAVLKRLGN